MVRTAAAQLPEPPHGADRIIVTGNAVVVLDGASAFEPAGVPPGEYASRLGASIAAALTDAPAAPLASVLAEAITATAAALGLDGGDSHCDLGDSECWRLHSSRGTRHNRQRGLVLSARLVLP